MVKEPEQFNDRYDIPIWRKYTLSVQEASRYFHIGDKKLRKLIDENPGADFILWNGTRPQIKRRVTLDRVLKTVCHITQVNNRVTKEPGL